MDESGIVCPSCNKAFLESGVEELEVPNYGKTALYYLRCRNCGYKINDFAFSGNHPTKAELKVNGKQDLFSKIIRGNQCTVSIPELGLSIHPGPIAETFITNIEGLLERFLRLLPLFQEGDKVNEKREAIMRAMNGEIKFTVMIEDPTGVSYLVGSDVPIGTS